MFVRFLLNRLLFAITFLAIVVCLVNAVFVISCVIQFCFVPMHEIGHIVAINCVESWSNKTLDIVDYSFFNADFDSPTNFCISIVEMVIGERSLGYVRCPTIQVLMLSKWEKYIIGFAGGAVETIFLILAWICLSKRFLDRKAGDSLDKFMITYLFDFPFLWVIIGSILYTFEEASKYGIPFRLF